MSTHNSNNSSLWGKTAAAAAMPLGYFYLATSPTKASTNATNNNNNNININNKQLLHFHDTGTILFLSTTFVTCMLRINWPRCIFRFVFGFVAPTKERWFPSNNNNNNNNDRNEISPEARGLQWILCNGPPPPHDIQAIRTMMKYFWPNIWPCEKQASSTTTTRTRTRTTRSSSDCYVECIPIPHPNSETLIIWPSTKEEENNNNNNNNKNKKYAVFHIHGGGMIAGTTGTERGFAIELSRRLQVPVISVDYRLVPEYTVQDAIDDILSVYKWFHSTIHHNEEYDVSFMGGSAGASLSLLATLELINQNNKNNNNNNNNNVPLPKSLVLSSPAPGMEFLSSSLEKEKQMNNNNSNNNNNNKNTLWKSLQENANVDGYMAGEFYQYVTSIVYNNPINVQVFQNLLSPLSLSNLNNNNNNKEQPLSPSIYITAGSYEVIVDGIHDLVTNLREANATVTYKEYTKMQHCHFAFFEMIPEANDALNEIITWIQQQ